MDKNGGGRWEYVLVVYDTQDGYQLPVDWTTAPHNQAGRDSLEAVQRKLCQHSAIVGRFVPGNILKQRRQICGH